MNKIAPFLWFEDNAEEAAEFYLSVFPHARKLGEVRSKGVGPWPEGKIATITIELEGQEMVFLNVRVLPTTPFLAMLIVMDLLDERSDWGCCTSSPEPC